MFWIVSTNILKEPRYDEVIATLEKGGIPHQLVKVAPFAEILEEALHPIPTIPDGMKVMVIGYTTLVRIAKSQNWEPCFLNDNFDFEVWGEKYKGHLLNEDGEVKRFGDVVLTEPTFMRPCLDDKCFIANVIDPAEFHEWKEKIMIPNSGATVTEDTMVMLAEPKNILREYRCFMVDGKYITGSQYKLGDKVTYDANVPESVIFYAEYLAKKWQPARFYVIDFAQIQSHQRKAKINSDYKIVEINNAQSAGFYNSDVSKLVQVLENTFN